MTPRGLLIVVSGPSGTGKGTLCKALMARQSQVRYSVSATTRPPRVGELEGIHYYFLSREKFADMLQEDLFLEHATVYGNYYGTPKEPLLQALEEGSDIILEIDPQGALQVKEKYPACVMIYIAPPSMDELRQRIVNRGTNDPDDIERRLGEARKEMAFIPHYRYVLENDIIDNAVAKMEAILTAERCRVERNMHLVP